MTLGDSSYTPMGMSCQMEALVGRKVGFSRNENRLQSVTECPSVGN